MSRFLFKLVLLALLGAVVSCGDPASSSDETDRDDSSTPEDLWGETPSESRVDRLSDGAIWQERWMDDEVRALDLLGEREDLIVQDSESIWLLRGGERLDLDPGNVLTGATLYDTAALPNATRLLATDRGLHVALPGGVEPSPLEELLGDELVEGLWVTEAGSQEPTVWLATSARLLRWQGEQLFEVQVDDRPLPKARLIVDAYTEERTLWIASEERLVSMRGTTLEGDVSIESELLEGRTLEQLLQGSDAALWTLSGGEILRRDAEDGSWSKLRLGGRASALLGHPSAAFLWIITEDDRVWLLSNDELTELEGGEAGKHRAVNYRGVLHVADSTGLWSYSPGADFRFGGLHDRATLDAPREVTLHPVFPERVQAVRAWLDEEELMIPESAPWTLVLEPFELGEGRHLLRAEVSFGPGEPVVVRDLRFAIPPLQVTWSSSIEPLYAAHCSTCHDGGFGARTLATREQWSENIDPIIEALETELMPPNDPRPTAAQIEQLRQWKALGFPE